MTEADEIELADIVNSATRVAVVLILALLVLAVAL